MGNSFGPLLCKADEAIGPSGGGGYSAHSIAMHERGNAIG